VAADLKVDTLLIETFLREGDDLRIAVQLIDVKTESLLWKGAFDLKYNKLLTVQDQVAQQIIRGLELTLSVSETGRLKTDETVIPLAYEYYLRGVDLYSRGDFLWLSRCWKVDPTRAAIRPCLGTSRQILHSECFLSVGRCGALS
jgi:hypothetical protein